MPKELRTAEEIERQLLAALCAGSLTLAERRGFLHRLDRYRWLGPDHRVIYLALRRSRQIHKAELQHDVIAEVTRLGFPDIDITRFFVLCRLSKNDVATIVDALLSAGTEAGNT